jgi:transposase
LKQELAAIVQSLPRTVEILDPLTTQQLWQEWRMNLTVKFTLPQVLPPLRMLLVCDNLAGHKTPEFVLWLCEQGILPLYTPLGGSWLNMAESIQRILKRRALSGQHPQKPQQIITWFEEVSQAWNQHPTPFEWRGKRFARRQRERLRQQHRLGGSGACTSSPIPKGYADNNGYKRSK